MCVSFVRDCCSEWAWPCRCGRWRHQCSWWCLATCCEIMALGLAKLLAAISRRGLSSQSRQHEFASHQSSGLLLCVSPPIVSAGPRRKHGLSIGATTRDGVPSLFAHLLGGPMSGPCLILRCRPSVIASPCHVCLSDPCRRLAGRIVAGRLAVRPPPSGIDCHCSPCLLDVHTLPTLVWAPGDGGMSLRTGWPPSSRHVVLASIFLQGVACSSASG